MIALFLNSFIFISLYMFNECNRKCTYPLYYNIILTTISILIATTIFDYIPLEIFYFFLFLYTFIFTYLQKPTISLSLLLNEYKSFLFQSILATIACLLFFSYHSHLYYLTIAFFDFIILFKIINIANHQKEYTFSFQSLFLVYFVVLLIFLYLFSFFHIYSDLYISFYLFLSLFGVLFYRYCYRNEVRQDNIYRNLNTQYLYQANEEKYKQLEKENDIVAHQLHDLKKHIRIIEQYLNEENKDEMKEYINEIKKETLKLSNLPHSGNIHIDRVIHSYQKDLNDAQIQLNLECDDMDLSFISPIDLNALLANILENAIESCIRSKDKNIILKIRKQKSLFIIKMKNSCDHVLIKDNSLISIKEDKLYHGYGMQNINTICTKYQGQMKYSYDPELHIFTTIISIPYPSSIHAL